MQRNYELMKYDIAAQAERVNQVMKRSWFDKTGTLCVRCDDTSDANNFYEEYSKLVAMIKEYKEHSA